MYDEYGACPTIYGPVQSRRHGLSLGINLSAPAKKVCTWGCIYCQCGFGQRREPEAVDGLPTREEVLSSLRDRLSRVGAVDSVTLAGNGEPAAHPQFAGLVEDLLRFRASVGGKWVLNCLSNGSELDRDEVVTACDALDEAWIKLDCGMDELFNRLSRPIKRVGTVEQHVNRIKKLKRRYVQSLFWESDVSASAGNVGNWTRENRISLLGWYRELQPLEVHITTVARNTAFPALQAVAREQLEEFASEVRAFGISARVFK